MGRCFRRVCSILYWNVNSLRVSVPLWLAFTTEARRHRAKPAFCLTYLKSGYIKLSLTCRTHARMNSDTSCALDERMGTSQPQ